jgi:hypothetical protein
MRRLCTLILVVALPVSARAQDMNLSQILIDGEGWKQAGQGFKTIAGLAGDREGNLYIGEAEPGRLFRMAKDGTVKPLGVEFDAIRNMSVRDGVLILALGSKKGGEDDSRIAQLDLTKNEVTETRVRGLRDVIATRKGAIYYTVPAEKGVFLLGREGSTRKVGAGIDAPAGFALSPDQGTMIVGDANDKCLWAYRIDPDGSLVHRERYYAVWAPRGEGSSGTADMTVDATGRVFAATKYGVQMFDPTGRLSGILTNPPGYVAGPVAFAGPDGNIIYLACGDKLYARKTKTKGVLFPEKPKQ